MFAPRESSPPSTVVTWSKKIKITIKKGAEIIFGFLCYALLRMMGCCFQRRVVKDKDSDCSSLDDGPDLESQRPTSLMDAMPQKDHAEWTRTEERLPHDAEDERLSTTVKSGDIVKEQEVVLFLSRDSSVQCGNEVEPEGIHKDTGPSEAAEIETQRYDNASTSQQDHEDTASGTIHGLPAVDVHVASSKPFTFEDETTRRLFLEKADIYSEREMLAQCRSLNARINTLSAHLLREKNKLQESKRSDTSTRSLNTSDVETRNEASNANVTGLVKKALGDSLYREIVQAGKGKTASPELNASIQDGLDAWSVFCVHLAMKPMLFGLKLRTVHEIEDIFRQMADHEAELAQCWNRIRTEDSDRNVDPHIRAFLSDICAPILPQVEDLDEYSLLEEIYRRNLVSEIEHRRRIALHWRALLQKYELKLSSYKEAQLQTSETLWWGLREIFEIAGVDSPRRSKVFSDMILKIVKDAAALSKRTKTAVFSQNIEVVIVEPGSSFDKELMIPADEKNAGEVKCTIQLGLHAIDSEGNVRTLQMPEVLLADA